MPRKNLRSFECLHCGRVWTPRNPDSPKLKCPTCGKYLSKEVVKDDSDDDKSGNGGVSGVFVPPADNGDLSDPGPREDGEKDLLLDGEKSGDVLSVSAAASSEPDPMVEEIDPPAAEEPGPALPSSGLGGGMWAGLAVLIMGVIAALWYLYRKRSIAEDLDDVIPDRYPDQSDDLYGRGRLAYRGRA